jgi:hypothetical protein
MVGIRLADDERRDQLGISIQRDERPDLAIRTFNRRIESALGHMSDCISRLTKFAN